MPDSRKEHRRSAAASKENALDMQAIEGHVGYLLRRTQLLVFEDVIRALEPHGLRPATYSALVVIDANPGRSQREIASALGIQRPNFVAMMDEFETRGLAERLPSPTDRRSHALKLTERGTALLAEANKSVRAHEKRMAQKFTPEGINTLKAILRGK
ncbi:MAG: MarR family transcriptional regulator [Proteobacteria bacterium]|nr:MarR family transcriptional regulator [Pseudomonadota bacterium]